MNPLDTIVADLFCGAGGSSYGTKEALQLLGINHHMIAVNHWQVAIDTHSANLPEATTHCTNLDLVRPIDLVPSGRLGLLWASPECTYFSRARGAKPISDQQRMSAWLINRWLTDLDVTRLIVENVPEFVTWGPLCRMPAGHPGDHRTGGDQPDTSACGRPIQTKKGEYFEAWWRSLKAIGYKVEWKLINAADHGDATTRTRFFLQARKDRHKILWPEATHAPRHKITPGLFSTLQPYAPAASILNLENRGRSIFAPKRKQLSLNTRMRIARGANRFWGELAPWYIHMLGLPPDKEARFLGKGAELLEHPSLTPFVVIERTNNVPKDITQPLGTITTLPGMRLVQADLEAFTFANRSHSDPRDTDKPVHPATAAGGGLSLSTASFALSQNGGGEARPVSDPLPTIVGKGALSLASPALIQYNGRSDQPKPIDEPLGTITAKDRFGLAQPIILTLRGTAADQIPSTATSAAEPLGTISAGGRHHGIATALIHSAGGPEVESRPIDEPAPTILTRDHLAITSPSFIVPRMRERAGQQPRVHDIKDPLPTVTTECRHDLISPLIVQIDQSGMAGKGVRSAHEPAPTIVTKQNLAIASPLILQMANVGRDDNGTARESAEPVPTITGRGNLAVTSATFDAWASSLEVDPRRLALYTEDRLTYTLVVGDIFFRMLENPELAGAQGFPKDYKFTGKKTQITKQIGNAVCRNTARALVLAAFHDRQPRRIAA